MRAYLFNVECLYYETETTYFFFITLAKSEASAKDILNQHFIKDYDGCYTVESTKLIRDFNPTRLDDIGAVEYDDLVYWIEDYIFEMYELDKMEEVIKELKTF